jgi:hypothetical protein
MRIEVYTGHLLNSVTQFLHNTFSMCIVVTSNDLYLIYLFTVFFNGGHN